MKGHTSLFSFLGLNKPYNFGVKDMQRVLLNLYCYQKV